MFWIDIKLTDWICLTTNVNHLNLKDFLHEVRGWYSQSLLQSHDCFAWIVSEER